MCVIFLAAACGVDAADERPDAPSTSVVLTDPDADGLYASPGCDGSSDETCLVLPGPSGCASLLVTTTEDDRCVACLDASGLASGPEACAPETPGAVVACEPDVDAATEDLACWACANERGAHYTECVELTAPRASRARSP